MGIKIGLVGLGQFGHAWIQPFLNHPFVDELALCDIDAEKLARYAAQFHVKRCYPSLGELCKSDVDAIAIITQHWMHAPQAIEVMESGKHAYSAVPVISLPQGDPMLDWMDKLIATCRRTGMRYMMGETSYYRPQAMYCRAHRADFGKFVQAQGYYMHDVDLPGCNLRDVLRGRHGKDWNMSLAGDPPMHYPTHSIGGFLSAMDTHITQVACLGHEDADYDWFKADHASGNVFGNEMALFKLANGATAYVTEARHIGYAGFEGFSLYGTQASLTEDPAGTKWWDKKSHVALTDAQMRQPLPPEIEAAYRAKCGPEADIYGGHGGSHTYLVNEFVMSLVENRQSVLNAWVAARYFVPGVMAHKSAQKDGAWLDVPDWGDAPNS